MMKRRTLISAALIGCFAVFLAAAIADMSGKWKGSLKDPDGNDHQFHLVFNVNGDKLTGTAQAEGNPLDINDGKVTGDNFSFNVKDDDGNVIPVDGKYITQGDSISLNFSENSMKYHVTFVRDDK
ncbi:MAG: hypothetical protein JSU01_21930 [Bacteroidetes bacterium]|nr:hypothetical protein [Bacteroidota bacterium]